MAGLRISRSKVITFDIKVTVGVAVSIILTSFSIFIALSLLITILLNNTIIFR
jgi:hypothetical protein